MPDTERIKFGRTDGIVTIKAGETVLAESTDAVVLTENGYAPRLYFPVTDVNTDILQPSDTTSRCPYKGTATYYSAHTPDGELADIAWTYPEPIADASEIAGLVAFYTEKLSVSGT